MSPAPPTTHLAFLLHMHQPLYVEPAAGVALLPWVRLHAARAYLDVAAMLDEFPEVRLTVNFVPSLLQQLEAVAAGARDSWTELALRPTSSWSPDDKLFLLERFFSVQWQHGVEARPRYLELLEKRGRFFPPAEGPIGFGRPLSRRIVQSFSDAELRDLTVLFHLAWLGFAVRRGEPTVAELEARGRDFEAQDLLHLVELEQRAVRRVLPLYRALAERGQIELSATPFFHPILPLLCDSDAAHRAQPTMALPDRFSWPGDARRQVARGAEYHRQIFGSAPRGMWPAEGSISPEAVAVFRESGIGWLASDEGNLFRSLPPGTPHAALYQPARFDGVDLVFRDRDLSDRVGFSYSRGEAAHGVADLLGRVQQAGERARGHGIATPLVAVILDGENPWEQYPGSGEPFLRALFGELSRKDAWHGIRTTTVSSHLAAHPARTELSRLHSGSWIDSDFHIWIGDPVKNRAWNLLGRARRRFQAAVDELGGDGSEAARTSPRIADARLHLDAAEGSDWFWWFGEPFHSAEDALFDRLFRAHLAAAWSALGDLPPDELDAPVSGRSASAAVVPPRARVSPGVDGRVSSYYEWVGAGRFEVPRGAAMAEVPLVERVHFGCDDENLYLRCDPEPSHASRLATCTVEVTARTMDRVRRLVARSGARTLEGEGRAPVGRLACVEVLEMAVPFEALGARAGDRIELVLRLFEPATGLTPGEVVLARLPREGYLEVRLPDAHFDADHWFV